MLAALLVCFACAAPSGPRDPTSWLQARGADLMDTVGVRLSFGPGLGLILRPTQALQIGALGRGALEREFSSGGSGTGNTEARGIPSYVIGTIGRWGGLWTEFHREGALPGFSTRERRETGVRRGPIAGAVSWNGEEDRWRWSVGFALHLLAVGVDAEVRPVEVFDFLAGLVGFDPSSDDTPVSAVNSEDEFERDSVDEAGE